MNLIFGWQLQFAFHDATGYILVWIAILAFFLAFIGVIIFFAYQAYYHVKREREFRKYFEENPREGIRPPQKPPPSNSADE